MSRSENVARNMTFEIISRFVGAFISFVVRTIFIQYFSIEYLGVNGLFSNILTLLSFAELGIGNAMIYSLYKPIAVHDKEKVKSLMQLYKKSYQYIGFAVAVIGLLCIPFIDKFIKETPNISENIIIIYVFFLVDTVLSYMFVYKQSILMAEQKRYVATICVEIANIVMAVIRIITIVIFHNYYLYLGLTIFTSILGNVVVAICADRMYPYLREGNVQSLCKHEKKEIFSDVKALFIYKFAGVVLNGTDNIIISKMLGLSVVGLCSNYTYVITTITSILSKLLNSFTASIGNLNAIERKERKEEVFYQVNFICFWIYGFLATGLFNFLNQLVEVWLGENYLLSQLTILALALNVFVDNVAFPVYTYRVTLGLFRQGKIAPPIAAILNIILSILLCKWIGLPGVFFATSLSRLLSHNIIDPILVYRHGFEKKPIVYYCKYLIYVSTIIIAYLVSSLVSNLVVLNGLGGLFIRVVIYSAIYNIIFILFYIKSKEFEAISNIFKRIFGNISSKFRKLKRG